MTLNGAAHGFPVIEKEVFAFKQTSGRIGLGSRYGLMAFCTSKLEVRILTIIISQNKIHLYIQLERPLPMNSPDPWHFQSKCIRFQHHKQWCAQQGVMTIFYNNQILIIWGISMKNKISWKFILKVEIIEFQLLINTFPTAYYCMFLLGNNS